MPVLITGQLVGSTAVLWFNVQSVSLRQAITPSVVLGRVNAAVRLVGFGTIPIGAALGGYLGEVLGLRPTLLGAAVLAGASAGLLLVPAVRRIRTTPDPEPVWADSVGADAPADR